MEAVAKRRRYALPLEPRGLSRERAADYLGISERLFTTLVSEKRMPEPRCINDRVVWDRYELDAAFEQLPKRNDHAAEAWECAV